MAVARASACLKTRCSGCLRPRREGPLPARALPPIFDRITVPIAALIETGLPLTSRIYAALGAGLGSFIWVDNLMTYGADPTRIVALGITAQPYSRYLTLLRNSQLGLHERLRSNSESTPDNIWGTPGYAAREA